MGTEAMAQGVRVWACVPAGSLAGASVRLRSLGNNGLNDGDLPAFLHSTLHQNQVPSLCDVCAVTVEIVGQNEREFRSGATRGKGCDACKQGITGHQTVASMITKKQSMASANMSWIELHYEQEARNLRWLVSKKE